MMIGPGHIGATRLGTTVVAAFLASMVECVEALTVVLAVGSVRGWRSALTGTAAALALLGAIVAALGPALSRIPLHLIQLVVGTMILLFGLRWLRKAILRAAGLIPLHDEQAAFQKNAAAMRSPGAAAHIGGRVDKLAFAAAFNITMLEGTEVVFLVIALGAGAGGLLRAASLGAAAALLVVIALGVALHRPLARIPENTLKFVVGVLLSAFGTFWVSEGAGLRWPGPAATSPELAIPALMAAYLALALCLVPACRALAGIALEEN
jgi:uncharacterized membrane protein